MNQEKSTTYKEDERLNAMKPLLKVHWLVPGLYTNKSHVINSKMASIRLRAGVISQYGAANGIDFTAGDHIVPETDVVVIGKIGKDCATGRDRVWLDQILAFKYARKKIVVDYTDHHLANLTSPMRPFYLQALPYADAMTVSSEQMKAHLQGIFAGRIETIFDPIEASIAPPKKSSNPIDTKTVLWFGHATNITYLIDYLQNQQLCNGSFNLIVLCNEPGLKRFVSSYLNANANIKVKLGIWSINNMERAASESHACIIPSDLSDPLKSGASSNRLLTSFALGLPTLADQLPSYQPYGQYFSDIRSIKLSDFLNQTDKETKKITMAQEVVLPQYTKGAMANVWSAFLHTLD